MPDPAVHRHLFSFDPGMGQHACDCGLLLSGWLATRGDDDGA